LVVNVYDLIIFPALWLEALILRKMATLRHRKQKAEKGSARHNEKSMTLLEEAAPCKKTAD
jgi:hypothetical protein